MAKCCDMGSNIVIKAGEEQASKHVLKPRPNFVQVGSDPKWRRQLRSPGQVQ